MDKTEIREKLFTLQDEKYKKFAAKLIPNIDPEKIIGIRTPTLRKFAKEIAANPETGEFLKNLPHKYQEENGLHAFIVGEIRDFDRCVEELEEFLPYVDNWAICDSVRPACFKKNAQKLLPYIDRWLLSGDTYTVRFGIEMLMVYFLDGLFDIKYPKKVAEIRSEEYYINMMIAWYFATALAKQYEAVLPFIEQKKLSPWVHNKTIQKAIESYRLTSEQKQYLRTLKIKN